MLNTGLIINNRYRIVKLLGQGGFGAVYRAWDINLNRPCALKMNLDTSQEAQRQFQREASTLSGLLHPNLPRVTDHFYVAGQGQFLVMDYADGEDLETRMAREGQFAPEQALPIITQVADALAYLHQQEPPIIHRDIKPANIRINAEGHVFLVDFGLAKVYDQHLRTTIGARAVTPGFSPPEQYGQGNTDARTDVYALAATLYTLLTGAEPQESVQRIVEDKLQSVAEVNTAVSEPMSIALRQAMSLNPSQRYQTIDEFVQSLTQPTSSPGITATPADPVAGATNGSMITPVSAALPPPEGLKVSPVWWVLGTAVLLSGIFLLVILPNMRRQTAQELAWQITRQAQSTAVVQTSIASATSYAEVSATETARVSTFETIEAQGTATAVAIVQGTSTARAEATATRQTATAVSARATSSARSTATREAFFARATATVRVRENTVSTLEARANRTFGPSSGALAHEEDDYIEVDFAGVSYKNFIAEATFENPYSPSTGSWDYGFLFRNSGGNDQFRLSIHSDKTWKLTDRSGDSSEVIDSGSISPSVLRTSIGTTNKIRLICNNDQGWLYINDKFIAELDLSSRTNSGAVGIVTGFYNGDVIDGEETRYTGFTVWSLP